MLVRFLQMNRQMQRITICGFMGSGKSTFLKQLKKDAPAEVKFFDSDSEFEKLNKMEIFEYISRYGEDQFRQQEMEVVRKIYQDPSPVIVVALGGGSLESQCEFILEQGLLIWVDTTFETCLQRIRQDQGPIRPLAASSDSKLRSLYEKRCKNYQKAGARIEKNDWQYLVNWKEFLSWVKGKDII
jgi:shikimate kinase